MTALFVIPKLGKHLLISRKKDKSTVLYSCHGTLFIIYLKNITWSEKMKLHNVTFRMIQII